MDEDSITDHNIRVDIAIFIIKDHTAFYILHTESNITSDVHALPQISFLSDNIMDALSG